MALSNMYLIVNCNAFCHHFNKDFMYVCIIVTVINLIYSKSVITFVAYLSTQCLDLSSRNPFPVTRDQAWSIDRCRLNRQQHNGHEISTSYRCHDVV